jgi:hypothetical protein
MLNGAKKVKAINIDQSIIISVWSDLPTGHAVSTVFDSNACRLLFGRKRTARPIVHPVSIAAPRFGHARPIIIRARSFLVAGQRA